MMVIAAAAPVAAQKAAVPAHMTVVVHSDLHTGKLVQSVVVQSREVAARIHEPIKEPVSDVAVAANATLVEMIDQVAGAYGVEGPLVHSVIRAESNYNVQAVSNKGALGMMQLIPATARRFDRSYRHPDRGTGRTHSVAARGAPRKCVHRRAGDAGPGRCACGRRHVAGPWCRVDHRHQLELKSPRAR